MLTDLKYNFTYSYDKNTLKCIVSIKAQTYNMVW